MKHKKNIFNFNFINIILLFILIKNFNKKFLINF